MSSFPEEQLDSPAGYFAAQPGQSLNNGEWKILRKLGWGPRSSSWLAVDTEDPEDVEVLKIFTSRATKDSSATKEIGLLQGALKAVEVYGGSLLNDNFYEVGPKGKHLVQILRPLGSSVEALRLSNTSGGSLPVHAVQKIIGDILQPLSELDRAKVVHGSVTPDNFLFFCFTSKSDLTESYEKIPPPTVQSVIDNDGQTYPAVISQPIPHYNDLAWDSKREKYADSTIYLSNFGHARHEGKHVSFDVAQNLLPPEVLLGDKVTTKANIWQLGATAYLLLTGSVFLPSDSGYVDKPEVTLHEKLLNIEEDLKSSGKIATGDIPGTAAVLRSCLAFDPQDRPSADALLSNKWIEKGAICSCGWCEDES